MNSDIFNKLGIALLILMLQVLVLNGVHLFGLITPMLILYPLLISSNDMARWAKLLLGFAIGVVSDVFSDTPGVGAASMTLIALVQPYLLNLFLSRGDDMPLTVSIRTLGQAKFLSYALMLTLLFSLTFYALEAFTFFNAAEWVIAAVGSAAFSYLIIIGIEIFRKA